MASNKAFHLLVALTTTTTTNILNPPDTTGGIGTGTPATYIILRHLRVANRTNTAARFALWLGATGANAAGTECIAAGTATAGALDANSGISVAGQSYFDWYGAKRIEVADFLVGGAQTASALTLEIEGEIGFA